MDLETENRLAAILMREAAELRRQSAREGVLAYLRKPDVRTRPNSRFLTATVRGVQQANRVVEVNEMWRLRHKELELDKRIKEKSIDKKSKDRSHRDDNSSRCTGRHADNNTRASASRSNNREYGLDKNDKSSSDRSHKDDNSSRSPGRDAVVDKSPSFYTSCSSEREHEHGVEGLKDEELEEFLHSRTKRGRGAVGPRMDETGPYLPPDADGEPGTSPNARHHRVIFGPEKPLSLGSYESSYEEELHEERRKKSKRSHSRSSDKEHSKRRKSKDKSKHKKKKREEKRSKHHH
ncbi:hypothetical protein ACSQ67_013162 [Phaseolus vulgaris]